MMTSSTRKIIDCETEDKSSKTVDSDAKAPLLDRHPISGEILNRLMLVCGAYHKNMAVTGNKSLGRRLCLQQHDDDSSCCKACQTLLTVENELLPELSSFFENQLHSSSSTTGGRREVDVERFVETAVTLMGKPQQHRRKVYHRGHNFDSVDGADCIFSIVLSETIAAKGGKPTTASNKTEELVSVHALADFVHRLALACYRLDFPACSSNSHKQTPPAAWSRSISSVSSFDEGGDQLLLISKEEWQQWMRTTAPEVYALFHAVLAHFLLGELAIENRSSAGRCLFTWVANSAKASIFWTRPNQPVPLQLALMGLGDASGGKARRLFCSDYDGLSFSTLMQGLLAFDGPTLLLLETTTGDMLGYYTELTWKTSPMWYSTQEDTCRSFLFRLHPSWNVYRLIAENDKEGDDAVGATSASPLSRPPWSKERRRRNHQYLYLPPKSRPGMLAGLAVGGIADGTPRLHLNPSLEGCRAVSVDDQTFASGPLLHDENDYWFDVGAIEVWALVNKNDSLDKGLAAGRLQADMRESARVRASRVDRQQFVDDFCSGAYMNHVYQHRSTVQGRGEG